MNGKWTRMGTGALLVTGFVLVLGTVGLECEAFDTTALILKNGSGADVYGFYIQPVASRPYPERLEHDDWGANLIPVGELIQAGASRAFYDIPNDTYDLLAVGYRSPIAGGGLVRWTQWDCRLSGGVYKWEFAPVKDSSEDSDGDSAFEQTSPFPAFVADRTGLGD